MGEVNERERSSGKSHLRDIRDILVPNRRPAVATLSRLLRDGAPIRSNTAGYCQSQFRSQRGFKAQRTHRLTERVPALEGDGLPTAERLIADRTRQRILQLREQVRQLLVAVSDIRGGNGLLGLFGAESVQLGFFALQVGDVLLEEDNLSLESVEHLSGRDPVSVY
jgi:hypothetical protein